MVVAHYDVSDHHQDAFMIIVVHHEYSTTFHFSLVVVSMLNINVCTTNMEKGVIT
jgi:hypothetical protein